MYRRIKIDKLEKSAMKKAKQTINHNSRLSTQQKNILLGICDWEKYSDGLSLEELFGITKNEINKILMELQKLQYVTIIPSRGNSNVTCINVHPKLKTVKNNNFNCNNINCKNLLNNHNCKLLLNNSNTTNNNCKILLKYLDGITVNHNCKNLIVLTTDKQSVA